MVLTSSLKTTAVAVLLAAPLGMVNAAQPNLHLAVVGLLGGAATPCIDVPVTLTGLQEIPPVKTKASGSGTFKVCSDGTITGHITTHGMRGTMAHIHQAAPGHPNGPPIITLLSGPHDTWLVPSGSKLTPDQYKSFRAGYLYVNVHSAAHPSGEIRAQLRPSPSPSQMFLSS